MIKHTVGLAANCTPTCCSHLYSWIQLPVSNSNPLPLLPIDGRYSLLRWSQLNLDPGLCPKEKPRPNPSSSPGRFCWRSHSVPLWNGSSSPHRCLRKEYFCFRAQTTVQYSFLHSFWVQSLHWELSKMNSHPHRPSSLNLSACAVSSSFSSAAKGTTKPSTSVGTSLLTLPQELAFGLVHDVCREQDGAAHRVLPHGREGGILDYWGDSIVIQILSQKMAEASHTALQVLRDTE